MSALSKPLALCGVVAQCTADIDSTEVATNAAGVAGRTVRGQNEVSYPADVAGLQAGRVGVVKYGGVRYITRAIRAQQRRNLVLPNPPVPVNGCLPMDMIICGFLLRA